jgi:hypothetical protein
MVKETEDIQENEGQCNCRHHISYPLSENQKLQCCNRMQYATVSYNRQHDALYNANTIIRQLETKYIEPTRYIKLGDTIVSHL